MNLLMEQRNGGQVQVPARGNKIGHFIYKFFELDCKKCDFLKQKCEQLFQLKIKNFSQRK